MPAKPRINVTQVWVLQRGVEYDGTEILNVYLDPDEVMKEHTDLGTWSYNEKEDYYSAGDDTFYLLTRHPVLVTRQTKTDGTPRRYVPCVPGTAPDGSWRCATCGQSEETDCLEAPHISPDPKDWFQPELVLEALAAGNI